MRRRNTTRQGGSFSQSTVVAVWRKGRIVPGYDPAHYRVDTCGAWMAWNDYGNTSSKHGWEIDHVVPVSQGGSDSLSNLQPLQWENNRYKSDKYPNWTCAVGAA